MYKLNKPRGPWETDTDCTWQGKARSIVIEVEPRCLVLRPKGTRQRLRLPWPKLLVLAAQAEADLNRQRKHTVKRGMLSRT